MRMAPAERVVRLPVEFRYVDAQPKAVVFLAQHRARERLFSGQRRVTSYMYTHLMKRAMIARC